MAKKKSQKQAAMPKQESEAVTLKDQLGGDTLEKLQAAKKALVEKERAEQEELEAKKAFERKQREKNMSFEELLNQYGDQGSKF